MPRLDLPGQFYHVMVRGVDRCTIFRTSGDRSDFLGRLAKGLSASGTLCYAWALMKNHFHLFLLSGANGLVSLMHPMLTGYVGAFNRRYDRVGHLVQNRYKAILCDAEAYFRELVRYIHLNPVRAGIIKTMEELDAYPWTGHPHLIGKTNLLWQQRDAVLAHFGSTVGQARAAYRDFLDAGWDQGVQYKLEGRILKRSDETFDARILGDEPFVENILKQAKLKDERMQTAKTNGLSLSALQCLAAQATGAEPSELRNGDRRHVVSQARALFVYAATDLLQYSSAEIASVLGLGSSSVSAARIRGRKLAGERQFDQKVLEFRGV